MLAPEMQEQVRQRAQGRCEYCRDALLGKRPEIDHIVPRSKGGQNTLDNLALACPSCNGNKGDAQEAVDAVTGATVRLFSPRRDAWGVHFTRVDGIVTGQTPVGRATAALLFRVTRADFGRDVHWTWIASLDDEHAYTHLNRLRVLRLANRFEDLDRALAFAGRFSGELCAFLHYLLRVEALIARGRESDLARGERLARRALRSFGNETDRRKQIYANLGGIIGRRGTLLALGGERQRAQRLWQEALALRELSGPRITSGAFEHSVRIRGQLARFGENAGMIDATMTHLAEERAAVGRYPALVALCDVALASTSTPPLDRLLDSVTRTLARSAYGSDRDHAATVVLRRRWWGLLIAAGERPDLDLLRQDLAFWRRIEMFNELRELEWTLRMPWAAKREETNRIVRATLTKS
jgi:hypothetical protein